MVFSAAPLQSKTLAALLGQAGWSAVHGNVLGSQRSRGPTDAEYVPAQRIDALMYGGPRDVGSTPEACPAPTPTCTPEAAIRPCPPGRRLGRAASVASLVRVSAREGCRLCVVPHDQCHSRVTAVRLLQCSVMRQRKLFDAVSAACRRKHSGRLPAKADFSVGKRQRMVHRRRASHLAPLCRRASSLTSGRALSCPRRPRHA